jgi:hypothetical protein
MRVATSTLLSLATLLPNVLALTFTSPTAGEQINPGLPLTITWTTSPSDPSTITLLLIHSSSSTSTLATSISASGGSYTVPAWWVLDWGNGYTLEAQSGGGGAVVGKVEDLSLAGGVGEITTDATGGLSFVSTADIATASQGPNAQSTGSDGQPLVTILSASDSASVSASASASAATSAETSEATETETSEATETETSAEESASRTSGESSESTSASATESTAAASSTTAGSAAGHVRVAAGGVLGAVVVALMA